jgi:TatD DNase family protein
MASSEPDSNCTKTPEKSSMSMQQCYENYIIIDVGANLTNKKYGRDLDSVVQRAKDAGMCMSIFRWNYVAARILSEVWVMWLL